MTVGYEDVLGPLREAYDGRAAWRDRQSKEPWKVAERQAVFAMNCLLHVPNHDLPAVLAAVRSVLRPDGLFFIGVYGGNVAGEGVLADDEHVPPRFFSRRTDEQLLGFATGARFDIVDFHPVGLDRGHRFQSLTLRRPGGG